MLKSQKSQLSQCHTVEVSEVSNFKGFRLMPPTLEAPPGDSSKTALGGIEARFQLLCYDRILFQENWLEYAHVRPPNAAKIWFWFDFGQVWGQLYPDLAQDSPDVALSVRTCAPTRAQIEPRLPRWRAIHCFAKVIGVLERTKCELQVIREIIPRVPHAHTHNML